MRSKINSDINKVIGVRLLNGRDTDLFIFKVAKGDVDRRIRTIIFEIDDNVKVR